MQIPTHFKDKMEQAEFYPVQLVDVKVSIYSFFSKQDNVKKYGQFTNSKLKEEDIPQDYLRCPSSLSNMSGHTPMMLLTTSRSPEGDRSAVSIAIRRDSLNFIQSRCSAPFNIVTMNSVIEKGSDVPKTIDAVFYGTISEAAHQKWGILQGSLCSHSQDTPCGSPPGCKHHQKDQQVMPHCRYSQSRTTKGESIIFSRCLSFSFSGSWLPSKFNSRQSGVSRQSRCSRAKLRCLWKCRIIPYSPGVRTDTSFRHTLQ